MNVIITNFNCLITLHFHANRLIHVMVFKSFLPSPQLSEVVRNYTIIQFHFGANEPPPVKQRSPKPEQKLVFYLKTLPKFYNPVSGNVQVPSPVSILSHQSDQKAIRLASDFFAFIIFLQ